MSVSNLITSFALNNGEHYTPLKPKDMTFQEAFNGMPEEAQGIGTSFLFIDKHDNERNAIFAGDYAEAVERFMQHPETANFDKILDCAEFTAEGDEVEGIEQA